MNAVNASQRVAVVGHIEPDAYAAAAYETDVVDMSKFERLVAFVQAGTLGTSATLDFKLQGATTSGGSYADISGAAITQLTQAGTDSDKVAVLELKAESIASTGYRYVKGVLTVGTATSDCGAILLGFDAKYNPASDHNLAEVDEIVVV